MEKTVELVIAILSWKVVVLIVAVLFMFRFHEQIRELLRRLSRLKVAGADLEFPLPREAREAEKGSRSLPKPPDREEELPPDPEERGARKGSFRRAVIDHLKGGIDLSIKRYRELLGLAEVSPREAILKAWAMLERAAYVTAERGGVSLEEEPNPVQSLVDTLIEHNIFNEDSRATFARLDRLAAVATVPEDHPKAPEITPDGARPYVEAAMRAAASVLGMRFALGLVTGKYVLPEPGGRDKKRREEGEST